MHYLLVRLKTRTLGLPMALHIADDKSIVRSRFGFALAPFGLIGNRPGKGRSCRQIRDVLAKARVSAHLPRADRG